MRLFFPVLFCSLASAMAGLADDPPAVAQSIKTILSVGKEGTGNSEAAKAWKELTSSGATALIPTLIAFDTANPTAANWLRSAIDALVEVEKKADRKLDETALIGYIQESKRNPAARRIAFELLTTQNPTRSAELLNRLIDDPSPELRRDSIAASLAKVPSDSDKEKAKSALLELFGKARDKDQVEDIAKRLEKLETKVNLTTHFGMITQWQIAGPFDGEGGSGFAKSYPAEQRWDATEKFAGKGGAIIGWKSVQSFDTLGDINLNDDVGKFKNATAYAMARLVAPNDMPCQFRVSSINAVQVFLNGQKLFQHEEYHHGNNFDQYLAKGQLKKGENTLVIKISQNDQPQPWAQEWQFAARICDATGGKLPVKQMILTNDKMVETDLGALRPAPPKKDQKKGGA